MCCRLLQRLYVYSFKTHHCPGLSGACGRGHVHLPATYGMRQCSSTSCYRQPQAVLPDARQANQRAVSLEHANSKRPLAIKAMDCLQHRPLAGHRRGHLEAQAHAQPALHARQLHRARRVGCAPGAPRRRRRAWRRLQNCSENIFISHYSGPKQNSRFAGYRAPDYACA